MADQTKTWAYTSLAEPNSVRLEIDLGGEADHISFEVVQWTGTWAINQVPESMCMLAMGRKASNVASKALIHAFAPNLTSMRKARVYFKPSAGSELAPDGTTWPQAELIIFEGYYVGISYPKVNGKVTVVVHLLHWLTDLGFTSTLSAISHPENPESMTFPAISQMPTGEEGAGQPGDWYTGFLGSGQVYADLAATQDVWATIKNFMCSLSNVQGFSPILEGGQALAAAGLDINQLKINNRAGSALARIEGPGDKCTTGTNLPYKYGKNLKFKSVSIDQAYFGIAQATCYANFHQLVHLTMWDLLIGEYCPTFQIDLCPQIDRAVVVPSCPGFNADVWKTITPDEYDYVDQSGNVPKPLRAVVAHGSVHGETGANQTEPATSLPSSVAGAYASKAQEDGDGAIIYVRIPGWIGEICNSTAAAGETTGTKNDTPTKTAVNPDVAANKAADKTPADMIDQASTIASQYARSAFVQNCLRGRVGTISGKLRFDIGPGSHLKVLASPEKFIGAEDGLAATLFGQVNRVTCEIDAEGRRASTSFVLSHLRNDAENQSERTSVKEHPIYGANVPTGVPLRPEFEFAEEPIK